MCDSVLVRVELDEACQHKLLFALVLCNLLTVETFFLLSFVVVFVSFVDTDG